MNILGFHICCFVYTRVFQFKLESKPLREKP